MAKIKLIGTKPFTHAGHEYVVQFKAIDGYNIELIEGFAEEKNHSQARISALHNSIHKLTRDGTEINLEIRSDGGTNIPTDYDPDAPKNRRFVKDVLLGLLVNNYQTFLADEIEATFGKYADAVEEEEGNPTTGGTSSAGGTVSEFSRSTPRAEDVG